MATLQSPSPSLATTSMSVFSLLMMTKSLGGGLLGPSGINYRHRLVPKHILRILVSILNNYEPVGTPLPLNLNMVCQLGAFGPSPSDEAINHGDSWKNLVYYNDGRNSNWEMKELTMDMLLHAIKLVHDAGRGLVHFEVELDEEKLRLYNLRQLAAVYVESVNQTSKSLHQMNLESLDKWILQVFGEPYLDEHNLNDHQSVVEGGGGDDAHQRATRLRMIATDFADKTQIVFYNADGLHRLSACLLALLGKVPTASSDSDSDLDDNDGVKLSQFLTNCTWLWEDKANLTCYFCPHSPEGLNEMREMSIRQQARGSLSHNFLNDMGAAFTDIACLYLEVFLSGLECSFERLTIDVGQTAIEQDTFCRIIREAGLKFGNDEVMTFLSEDCRLGVGDRIQSADKSDVESLLSCCISIGVKFWEKVFCVKVFHWFANMTVEQRTRILTGTGFSDGLPLLEIRKILRNQGSIDCTPTGYDTRKKDNSIACQLLLYNYQNEAVDKESRSARSPFTAFLWLLKWGFASERVRQNLMQLHPNIVLGGGPAQVATGINDSIRAMNKLVWLITAQHQQEWKKVRNAFPGVPRNGFAVSSLLTATRDAVDFLNELDVHPNELLMPSAVTTALGGEMTSYDDVTYPFYFWWSVYLHHTYTKLRETQVLRTIINNTVKDTTNITAAGMREVLDAAMQTNSFGSIGGFVGEDGDSSFHLSLMTFYRNFFVEEREQKLLQRWRMLLEAETTAACTKAKGRDPTSVSTAGVELNTAGGERFENGVGDAGPIVVGTAAGVAADDAADDAAAAAAPTAETHNNEASVPAAAQRAAKKRRTTITNAIFSKSDLYAIGKKLSGVIVSGLLDQGRMGEGNRDEVCQQLGLDEKVIPSNGTTNGFDSWQVLGLQKTALEKKTMVFWEKNNNNQNGDGDGDGDGDTQFFEQASSAEGESQSSSSSALEADRDGNGQTDSSFNGSNFREYQHNVKKGPRGKSGDDDDDDDDDDDESGSKSSFSLESLEAREAADFFLNEWKDNMKEKEEKWKASIEEADGHACADIDLGEDCYGFKEGSAANKKQRAMEGGDDADGLGKFSGFEAFGAAGGCAKGGAANDGLGENLAVNFTDIFDNI